MRLKVASAPINRMEKQLYAQATPKRQKDENREKHNWRMCNIPCWRLSVYCMLRHRQRPNRALSRILCSMWNSLAPDIRALVISTDFFVLFVCNLLFFFFFSTRIQYGRDMSHSAKSHVNSDRDWLCGRVETGRRNNTYLLLKFNSKRLA